MGKLTRLVDDMRGACSAIDMFFGAVLVAVCFILCLVCLALATPARAETIGAQNDVGGAVLITDEEQCEPDVVPGYTTIAPMNKAFAFDAGGHYMFGCSFVYGGFLYIVWDDYHVTRYPIPSLRPIKDLKPEPQKGDPT